MQVPWDRLTKKKTDSEELGRGDKGNKKHDKDTVTFHSKSFAGNHKGFRSILQENSHNNSKMATELVLDTPTPTITEKE